MLVTTRQLEVFPAVQTARVLAGRPKPSCVHCCCAGCPPAQVSQCRRGKEGGMEAGSGKTEQCGGCRRGWIMQQWHVSDPILHFHCLPVPFFPSTCSSEIAGICLRRPIAGQEAFRGERKFNPLSLSMPPVLPTSPPPPANPTEYSEWLFSAATPAGEGKDRTVPTIATFLFKLEVFCLKGTERVGNCP